MPRTARIVLIAVTLLLLLYGLTMLYSTSYAAYGETFLKKQLQWIAIGGICAVMVCWKLDAQKLGKYSWWMMCFTALLLAYLAAANLLHHFPVTRGIADHMPLVGGLSKGSARWIRLGPLSLQPSELSKPVIILFIASYMPRHSRYMKEFFRGFLKPLGMVGIVAGLILAGGDLKTTGIIGTLAGVAFFVGGVRIRYIVLVIIAGAIIGAGTIYFSPERWSRVTSSKDPETTQKDDGYQLWNSQLALGSGGWRGLGFTNSRIKRLYLPEAHTDFIVAIIGEELGLIGVVLLMLLYLTLSGTTFWIGALTHDRESIIICTAVGVAFALQAFINISVVSGFGPTTGVTAPFLSYGGSSMIVSLIMVGMVLSVSLRNEEAEISEAVEEQIKARRECIPSSASSANQKHSPPRRQAAS